MIDAPDRDASKTLHLPGHIQGTIKQAASAAPAATVDDDEPAAPAAPVHLKSAPRIMSVYWCEFPSDARRPEFWKTRPVIVVSHRNRLDGPVLVVPLTTKNQHGNEWAVRLKTSPKSKEPRESWAVCNHLYTVSCSRLSAFHGHIPRLSPEEFRPIHERVLQWIPTLLPLSSEGKP